MNNIDFESSEYQRSRRAYVLQCMLQYFVALLIADAFLAKLLTSLNFKDSTIGLISSIISLAFVIQLLSVVMIKSRKNAKMLVIIFSTLSNVFFGLAFFVPLLSFEAQIKRILAVIFIVSGYCFLYFVVSIAYKWANSFVQPGKRGLFSAKKEILSLISGIIFTTVVGYVLDRFDEASNLKGGFFFVSITILLIAVGDFVCISMIKRDSPELSNDELKRLGHSIKYLLRNKRYRSALLLTILFKSATYFTTGYIGVYKVNTLLISVFAVQLINIVSSGFRMVVSIPFGKYSDRHSYVKGFELALIIAMIAYAFCAFTTPKTWYFIIIYTALIGVSAAGTESNSYNIMYNFVDIDYFEDALAINNCVGGLCGFISALVAQKIIALIQENGNKFLGMNLYGQQVLAAISFLIMLVAILFVHFVISKKRSVE